MRRRRARKKRGLGRDLSVPVSFALRGKIADYKDLQEILFPIHKQNIQFSNY